MNECSMLMKAHADRLSARAGMFRSKPLEPSSPFWPISMAMRTKAASLAVYPDISPRYIQISVTGGISRYQPAAYDVLSRSYFLQPIGRTLYSPPATIQYMGVDHRSVDIFMAE